MSRVFVSFVVLSAFFFTEVYVQAVPNEENISAPSPRFKKRSSSSVLLTRQVNKESPLKKVRLSSRSPLVSPTSKERQYWSPIRREMALIKYKGGKRSFVSSPSVRSIYKKHDRGDVFRRTEFGNKTVFQADYLFDRDAAVLSKSGQWETNLERMERGLSPIGHRGIASEFEKENRAKEDIRKTQKHWRIDLQHVTQKDSGTYLDPICEMTHAAHLGLNGRLLLKVKNESQKVRIVHSSLEKETAFKLKEKEKNTFVVTNVLHFRLGGSLIDRSEFSQWRGAYWKDRALRLKAGLILQPQVRGKLFGTPKKKKSKQRRGEEARRGKEEAD